MYVYVQIILYIHTQETHSSAQDDPQLLEMRRALEQEDERKAWRMAELKMLVDIRYVDNMYTEMFTYT